MKKRLAFLLVIIGFTAAGNAATVFLDTRAGVGATDYIDWGVLGPSSTTVSNPFTLNSNGGVSVDVSMASQSQFTIGEQSPSSWAGNFAAGDKVLWTNTISNYLDLPINPIALSNFSNGGILAGGAQIQSNYYGDFVARIEAFDAGNTSLGFFDLAGNSNGLGDNSAIFLGISSDTTIFKIQFSVLSAAANPGSFTINQFDFRTSQPSSQPSPIPEPASLLLLGTGLGAIGLAAWRRRK